MDSHEAEDVVKLIFGDDAPSDWRENPEFLQYLTELGNLGADRLAVEPDTIAHQLTSVQGSTQELAFSNYKTFIETSECSADIYTQLTNTEKHLQTLTQEMPDFLQKCEEFKGKAAEISCHRKLTSLTLSKHTQLLEILELPQLMDTVVRNQHYDEALELYSYVTKLSRKQPDIQVLEDICRNVKNSVKLMLQQLLAQLRTSIQLPQCLKVISYLRRLDIFQENDLRLKFLQARETWLDSVTNAVPRDDAYIHITRTMEVMRVHLFDVVTQYRAIFSDDTFSMDQEGHPVPCDNRLLFSSWLSRKIEEFMKSLEQDLYKTTGSIETLLGQAMYFGLSFSRVGFDFRPMLIPVFERIIMRQMNQQLNVDSNLKILADSFSAVNLNKISGLKHTSPAAATQDDVSQPPLLLLDYPPLALACNHILATLNTLRLCAPVSCVQQVTTIFQQYLVKLSQQILTYHNNNKAAWSGVQEEGFKKLCSVYKSILLPYLQNCISVVFSPKHLSEISGLSVSDLRARNLSFLNTDAICSDIEQFIAKDEPVIESVATPSVAAEGDQPTDYVSERLAELSIAVQSPGGRVSELNGEAKLQEPQEMGANLIQSSDTVVENVEENVATSETSYTIPETNMETETAIAVDSNNTENIEKEMVENTGSEKRATVEETN